MRRIIFINLHKNGFLLKPFGDYLLKKVVVTKQQYLLKYLLENGYHVCSLIDENGGSRYLRHGALRNNHCFQKKAAKVLSNLTFYINRKAVLVNRIELLEEFTEISDEDIVIGYPMSESCFPTEKVRGKLAVSMVHFYGDKLTSQKLQGIQPDLMFAESYLDRHARLFERNYKWYQGKMILLAFVPESRFQIIKDFNKRKNKAMAIGTLTENKSTEFIEEYGTTAFQPQRDLIYQNKNIMRQYLDCFISKREEDGSKKEITGKENVIEGIYKRFFNILHADKQKKYFSFDMVERFNEYQMFVCPEDAHGNPGIGFLEGMSCGCAYIGQKIGVYEDYGMKQGIHYIGYNGELEDLKEKITYYQKEEHYEELLKIAKAGTLFVKEYFNAKRVAGKFVDELIKL